MATDASQNHGLFSNAQNVFVTNGQFMEVTGLKHHVQGTY